MGIFSKSRVELGQSSLTVKSRYVDLDIPYYGIQSADLRTDVDMGRIITGVVGGLTYTGQYKNDEFGMYDVLFHPTARILLVVKYGDGKTLAINARTAGGTEDLCRDLRAKCGMTP